MIFQQYENERLSKLSSHQKRQVENRSLHCELCQKIFATKYTLEKHLQIHQRKCTNLKKIQCKNGNKEPNKRPTQNTFDRKQYICLVCNRSFAYKKAAFHCTHNSSKTNNLRNQINNVSNSENIELKHAQKDVDRVTVKINLLTENRSEFIPLYEFPLPNENFEPAIKIPNSETSVDAHRNADPVVLVQAYTQSTPLNVNTEQNVPDEISSQSHSFKAFCASQTPEIIVIDDDSSSGCNGITTSEIEMDAEKSIAKTITKPNLLCSS